MAGSIDRFAMTGYHHTLAVLPNGTLWAWGNNSFGQLGLGDASSRSNPVRVGADSDWAKVSTGAFHSLAVKTDGTLWAAGLNADGQLGLGDLDDRTAFIRVGSGTAWATAHAGGFHSLAVKTDGSLWAFGSNSLGQLGLGDFSNRKSPVRAGAHLWDAVAAGVFHTLAIRQDGTLWGWGDNGNGQLGIPPGGNHSRSLPFLAPMQVGSAHDWLRIAAGFFHSMAIRVGGTLWGWGDNGNGQLGDNDSDHVTVDEPTRIGTDANWADARAGLFFTVASKTTDTLWAAGDNEHGQLGISGLPDPFTLGFVQIGSDTDWTIPGVVGRAHVFAGKTGGSVFFAWGRNVEGQLGDGTHMDRPTPVLVNL